MYHGLTQNEVSTYGLTSDEIQEIVKSELVPLISDCQTQAEEHLAAIEVQYVKSCTLYLLLKRQFVCFI